MNPRVLVSGLALLATLIAVGIVVGNGGLGELLSEGWMDREIRDKGFPGELLYLGVAAVATALGLPRQLVSFLGGYAFGVVYGTLFALAGTGIGCMLCFYYSRIIGRPLISGRLRARAQRVDDLLALNPFSMTVLIRLLPVGSNFVTNLAAGVSKVRATPFFLGSLLGYMPQTLIFALGGSGVHVGATWRIGIAIALFVASGAIGGSLYRRFRHGKTLGAEVDAALEEPNSVGRVARGRDAES